VTENHTNLHVWNSHSQYAAGVFQTMSYNWLVLGISWFSWCFCIKWCGQ